MRRGAILCLLALTVLSGLSASAFATEVADAFDYPVGTPRSLGGTGYVTWQNDRDGWYNYQDWGIENSGHSGEDWNDEDGGNSDIGAPVYSIANGVVTATTSNVPGEGIAIEHILPNGDLIYSVYIHINIKPGLGVGDVVSQGDLIGTIADISEYGMSAHLHFEIRTVPVDPQDWYPNDRQPKQDGYYDSIEALECDGLIDPSDFIDSHRGEVGLQMEESLTEPIQEMEETSAGGEAMGIDVSDYQGSIDWSQVAGAGYSFAFVKATEGEGWTGDAEARQQNFEANMQGASSAGMLVGAYHFARPDLGNSAEDEARWFVDVAGDYIKPGYLRPVLDIEKGASTLGSVALSSWVSEWMETVSSETGVEPLIYTSGYYASNYLENSAAQYDLWVAHWTYDPTQSPNTGIWDSWAFWQYSDMGEVPGISGDVDLDLFRGSESELSNFVIASASTDDQVTLTLYIHEESAYGPIIPGALVTGHDSSGNSFEQTTDSSGYVTITGNPGTWSFSVSADGYETNSWDQEITETDTKDAFLQLEETGEYIMTNEYLDNSTATICPPGSESATCLSPDSCVDCDGNCIPSGTDIGRGWSCDRGKWNYQPMSLSDIGTYRTSFQQVSYIPYDLETSMVIANVRYEKGVQLYCQFVNRGYYYADFNLNGAYSRLTGLLGLDDKTGDYEDNVTVTFIGDDRTLKTFELYAGDFPVDVDIDVSGISKFTVEVFRKNGFRGYVDLINMDLTDIGKGWSCDQGKWNYQQMSLSDLGTYRTSFQQVSYIPYDSEASMIIANVRYEKGVQLYCQFVNQGYYYADFNLNGEYSHLTGLMGLDDKTGDYEDSVTVTFIGDERTLETFELYAGDLPVDIDIDVSGIGKFTVEVFRMDGFRGYVDLINMDLQK